MVRFQPPELRLGRQPADHPCLNQGMLWVQLPPEPLLAFRARKHLANAKRKQDGTVRKPAKRPSSNLGERLWVRFPPVLVCVGWALVSPSACNPPAKAVQVQLLPDALTGPLVYRRRTPAPHAGRMGSIPIRATGMDQVVQLADTRRSERRAFGHGSSTLPLVTAEWTGVWFPARSHKPFDAGSNPASAT